MSVRVADPRVCSLGEGPLWHPERGVLYWFDINGCRLLRDDGSAWDFPGHVSAAGWVDADRLLIASETALSIFDTATGGTTELCPLEADNPVTRSNDGRADPAGGFWIGTMGRAAEHGAGAIYRYRHGELRRLYSGLTIPNAICFTADGQRGFFADTATGRIQQVALDPDGWPVGEPALFADVGAAGWRPDGAVIDAEGCLWNAQYGGHRVARYAPDGHFLEAVALPVPLATCPAFGGPELATLYCTSAAQGLSAAELAAAPHSGCLLSVLGAGTGRPEARVVL